jgi:hypothetical protein
LLKRGNDCQEQIMSIPITYPLSHDAFAALGAPDLVYVRAMSATEAFDQHPKAMAEAQLHPDQIVYSVHRADGERLAILTDRETAYAAAIAYDLAPVSVH